MATKLVLICGSVCFGRSGENVLSKADPVDPTDELLELRPIKKLPWFCYVVFKEPQIQI